MKGKYVPFHLWLAALDMSYGCSAGTRQYGRSRFLLQTRSFHPGKIEILTSSGVSTIYLNATKNNDPIFSDFRFTLARLETPCIGPLCAVSVHLTSSRYRTHVTSDYNDRH